MTCVRGSAVVVLACLSFGVAQAEPVTVFFPRGDCESGVIEVEIYDRDRRLWVAHSIPRVEAGGCRTEESGLLLNEFRVRCIDPTGRRMPSPWVVGAEVFRTAPSSTCAEHPEQR
jgi:hypothetical protein